MAHTDPDLDARRTETHDRFLAGLDVADIQYRDREHGAQIARIIDAAASAGHPFWLVRVCLRYYTVDGLRDWLARARSGMKTKNGQVERWSKALVILEVAKR